MPMFWQMNSDGADEVGGKDLFEKWSDAARSASAAKRKTGGKKAGDPAFKARQDAQYGGKAKTLKSPDLSWAKHVRDNAAAKRPGMADRVAGAFMKASGAVQRVDKALGAKVGKAYDAAKSKMPSFSMKPRKAKR